MQKFNLKLTREILENINNLTDLKNDKKLQYHLKAFEDLGLTKYKKRNSENFDYWWYEVDTKKNKYGKMRIFIRL